MGRGALRGGCRARAQRCHRMKVQVDGRESENGSKEIMELGDGSCGAWGAFFKDFGFPSKTENHWSAWDRGGS